MMSKRIDSIYSCHDKRKVNKALTKKIKQRDLEHLSSVFKALGDSARSQILHFLSLDDLCVHDISELTSLSQSATSHHLRILRSLRLVNARKKGKFVYYGISDEHVSKLIKQGLEHVREKK